MKQVSISVLMSIYKSEKALYFDQCMKSIWTDQTVKPAQVVLIQDGDIPQSLMDIIEKWKNIMGKVLVHHKNEENLGLTKSLNIGIMQYVSEKYIARMDSDDICDSRRFEMQYNYLESHPEIVALGSAAQEIDGDGKKLFLRFYPKGDNAVKKCIAKATPLQHSAVMMRSDVFKKGFVSYNEKYRLTQDLALWFDMLCAGFKIDNLDDVLLYFRITPGSFQRRNKVKARNELEIYLNGIYRLYGFTWRYVYPIFRYCYRMMPTSIVKLIFQSKLRNIVLKS